MSTSILPSPSPSCWPLPLTNHALERMRDRSIPLFGVEAVLDYGRRIFVRGAMVYALGRREVERQRNLGKDLSRFEGVQVVCADDGTVVTVYRNRNFRGLRSRRRGRPRRRRDEYPGLGSSQLQ